MDVAEYFDFDCKKVVEYAKKRNPDIEILFISAKTGDGVEAVAEWISDEIDEWVNR